MKLIALMLLLMVCFIGCGKHNKSIPVGTELLPLSIAYDQRPKQVFSDLMDDPNDAVGVCAKSNDLEGSDVYNCSSGYLPGKDSLGDYKIAYQMWTPKNVQQVKGTIIVVSGRGGYLEKDYHFVTRFSKIANDYAVVIFDHYGQGHSTGLGGHVDSIKVYVSDFSNIVSMVRTKTKYAPIHVVAHSMGGAVVTTYAAQESFFVLNKELPREVAIQNYVLIAPMFQITTRGVSVDPLFLHGLPVIMKDKGHQYKRFPLEKSEMTHSGGYSSIGDPTYSWLGMAVNEVSSLFFYDTFFKAMNMTPPVDAVDVVAVLKSANFHRFLVIQPENDQVVDETASQNVCERLGPLCTYHSLTNFDHDVFGPFDQKKTEKNDLFQEIIRFLKITN